MTASGVVQHVKCLSVQPATENKRSLFFGVGEGDSLLVDNSNKYPVVPCHPVKMCERGHSVDLKLSISWWLLKSPSSSAVW